MKKFYSVSLSALRKVREYMIEQSTNSRKKVRFITATFLTVHSAVNKIKNLVGRCGLGGAYVDIKV